MSSLDNVALLDPVYIQTQSRMKTVGGFVLKLIPKFTDNSESSFINAFYSGNPSESTIRISKFDLLFPMHIYQDEPNFVHARFYLPLEFTTNHVEGYAIMYLDPEDTNQDRLKALRYYLLSNRGRTEGDNELLFNQGRFVTGWNNLKIPLVWEEQGILKPRLIVKQILDFTVFNSFTMNNEALLMETQAMEDIFNPPQLSLLPKSKAITINDINHLIREDRTTNYLIKDGLLATGFN